MTDRTQNSLQPEGGATRTLPAFLQVKAVDVPPPSRTIGKPLPAFVADLLIATALALAAFLLYVPTLSNGFVDYDDPIWMGNPMVKQGLTLHGIHWAITNGSIDWLPMAWLSHMAAVSLFGLGPGWHHAVNAILHALNAGLVFLVLRSMTGQRWPAALVAALFAFHPLCVESVAWVTGRKDVLSGAFFLLTLLAYTHYVRRPGVLRYGLVLLLYAAALLSKSMVTTLPLLLLVLDIWPLQRGRWTLRTVAEKIPLLLLAVSTSVVTVVTQHHAQVSKGQHHWPLDQRAANAGVSVARYLGKLFWPVHLSAFYPYPATPWPVGMVIASAGLIIIVTVIAWRLRGSMPFVLVGWLWFIGMLVPVCGLVPVGLHSMADRYMYLPSIGLLIALVWTGTKLARERPPSLKGLVILAAVVLLALAAVSWSREEAWRSTFALFSDALAVDEQNWKAHDIVGSELVKQGDDAAAMRHFQRSAELNPGNPFAWVNTGTVLRRHGKTDQAVALFRKATELAPEVALCHQWLGLGLSIERDYTGADREFTEAVRLGPDDPSIPAFWAASMAARGRFDRARELAQSALNIDPADPTALHTMENIDRLQRRAPATKP